MRLGQRLVLKYIRTKFKLLSSISKTKAAEKAFRLFCTPQHRNTKKPSAIFDTAEKLSLPFGGNIVRGYRWNHGKATAGKVLILHGFESSIVNFDRYVKPLVQKGYEVLGFDAPAHGRSSGRTMDARVYRDLVLHIYKEYGPIRSFLAHSFGGLCLTLALEEIPHDNSTKVVLVAPAVETVTAIDNFFNLLKLDGAMRKEFDELIFRMGGQYPEWFSISRVAPLLKAQVLFLQDKEDRMTPLSDVEPIMEKNYANFHFVISEGLGHRRIYRDSRSLKTILEFL